MAKLKAFSTTLTEEEIRDILSESNADTSSEVDFEAFLRVSDLFLHFYVVYFYLMSKNNGIGTTGI